MFDFLKKIDKDYWKKSNKRLWLYGAYLTLRYVDDYEFFPAIQFNGKVKVKFYKNQNSKICLNGPLKFEQWLNKKDNSIITLGQNAMLTTQNEFIIGNNVTIFLANNSKLDLLGKKNESGSGITGNSILMVDNHISIGYDCIIAWDTYITDSDWHGYGEQKKQTTIINDHCWVGVGVKILKGVHLSQDSIVGSNSVVTKKIYPANCFISGIPARVVKENIEKWKR
jgi:acetyltransferase-like isoleucine patch superfamily enzyme